MSQRTDDFSAAVKERLAKRASYVCSNPDCRALTVAAAATDPEAFVYIGKAAHIRAASPGGPRYDSGQTGDERSGIENAIFLCSNCADLIDRNKGSDYPSDVLRRWKLEHESWVRANLNKSPWSLISIVDGHHSAEGRGEVVGIDATGPVFIQPGTRSSAKGEGTVIATRIGGPQERRP